MTIRVGFTGHRNCIANELELYKIHEEYPDAIWVHGNNKKGFDAQVDKFGMEHGHVMVRINPDYVKYPPHYAPFQRDELIVDDSDCMIALYDGRSKGGTKHTIDCATRKGREIKYIKDFTYVEDNSRR